MAFEVGQVYEDKNGQTAIVIDIRSGGREGLLRVDGKHEKWFLYTDRQWQLRRHTPPPTLPSGH
jgi:hypothetical protein